MINTLKIFNELKETIESSAAQKIAEVIGMVYEELQNTVTKKEFKELTDVVKELAEAQKRTEQVLYQLIEEHKDTKKQLGGLSDTVGYTLENAAYKALPELLKRDFGIIIKERLKREYVRDKDGKYIQINIIAPASRNSQDIMIIGESKSQLSKNKIDDFIRKKLNRLKGVFNEIIPILITHMTSEVDTEEYAKQNNIILYYSYDF